jgi:hypothetical protein
MTRQGWSNSENQKLTKPKIRLTQLRHRRIWAKCRCIRAVCCGGCGCSRPATWRRECDCLCSGPARQKRAAFPVPPAWGIRRNCSARRAWRQGPPVRQRRRNWNFPDIWRSVLRFRAGGNISCTPAPLLPSGPPPAFAKPRAVRAPAFQAARLFFRWPSRRGRRSIFDTTR